MHKRLSLLAVALGLIATPALAAPCKTRGTVEVAMTFPKNDAGDVPFARSMVAVMFPNVSGAVPSALTCTRATVGTPRGDYALGGENGEAYPRVALRADGKAGPLVYLSASPAAPGTFALVVHRPGEMTIIKRFYAGLPTDQRLVDDIRAALADDAGIMAFDPGRKLVSYGFSPSGGFPPPAPPGRSAGEAAGPQFMVLDSGDPRLLDMAAGMKHGPSGFACPQTFDGLAVLLMTIDPRADYLACAYRAGTELRFREDDPIRYQITLINPSHGETPRSVFDDLTAGGRASLHITGDHVSPLAAGPAPAPAFVAYWDTAGDGVQGVWVGKVGHWIIWLRAQYPSGGANDVEAGKVARILFDRAARQVR